MNYPALECFGYTIDILPPSSEQVQLVRLSQKSKSGFDLLVDRFDVQLLLEDPSILWDSVIDHTPELGNTETIFSEDVAFERLLDEERYHDLIPSSYIAFPEQASFLIPGPIVSTRLSHTNVPTAQELNACEHSSLTRPGVVSKPLCSEVSRGITAPSISSLPDSSISNDPMVPPKASRIFEPNINRLNKIALQLFMEEVKSRHASTGLPLFSFWPSSFAVHLSIELTASLLNSLPPDAEEKLLEFVSTVRDEDRLALGFLSKWHSLYPYYCLIRASHYVHFDDDPNSIPIELHFLFKQKTAQH